VFVRIDARLGAGDAGGGVFLLLQFLQAGVLCTVPVFLAEGWPTGSDQSSRMRATVAWSSCAATPVTLMSAVLMSVRGPGSTLMVMRRTAACLRPRPPFVH
jgi:hypothetical protein